MWEQLFYILHLCTKHNVRVRINKITILTLDLSDSDNQKKKKVNSSELGSKSEFLAKIKKLKN